MNIIFGMDPYHCMPQLIQICMPSDRFKGLQIRGLHTDFQLNQTGAHFCQKRQLFSVQQICRDLKMEIRNSIIVLLNIAPDFHCVLMITVEGSVNKFHLRNLLIKEKLQLLFHQCQISQTYPFVDGGQTVTAPKRTSAARFIVNDPICKILHILIKKRDLTDIGQGALLCPYKLPGDGISIDNTCNTVQSGLFDCSRPECHNLQLLLFRIPSAALFFVKGQKL